MLKSVTFRSILAAIACAISLSANAMADTPRKVDVPAGELAEALQTLAKQSGAEFFYSIDDLKGIHTEGVRGNYTTEKAVIKLLQGTKLKLTVHESGAMLIAPTDLKPLSPKITEGPKSVSDESLRMAQVDQGAPPSAAAVSNAESNTMRSGGPIRLEEVVVTAQKREERLQDVPIPVTALSASDLAGNNQTRLRDYYDTVPGLSVSPAPGAGGQQMVAIRGISTGAFGNPTVGITVDDVSYGSFTREFAPDIDPSDLQRVEVLRGPQGTLYGASSMGGLIKFVTVDPDTTSLFGRVEAGIDAVHNGDEPGYTFRGSVNVPLSETVALRASAFTRQDAGYIDNPVLGENGVNEAHVSGGRLSGLWHISDAFSLKVSALYQRTNSDGLSDVDKLPGLGDLQQSYIRGTGASDQAIQAYSAVLSGTVGAVNLTSVTGFNRFQVHTSNDYTQFLTGAPAKKFFGVSGGPIFVSDETQKVTQELRATIPLGSRLQWLIGGFFSHESTPFTTYEDAEDTSNGAIVGNLLTIPVPIKLTEFAAFTDLTIRFTDQFDVQLGARESFLNEDFGATTEFGAELAKPVSVPAIKATPNAFTYLVTPQFKITPDFMLYARAASGYRPGRANSFNLDPSIPRASSPDKTYNYEVGAKGDILDHAFSFDVSVYYIDFKNLQITLLSPTTGLTYQANGSDAKSEGVELALTARPLKGLSITLQGAYDDAALTKSFNSPAAYGVTGSKLPYSVPWSGNLSARQAFPLGAALTGYVEAAETYVGQRIGTFIATPARAIYPAYFTTDFRLGCNYRDWTANLYANNVTDRRGVLGGGAGTYPPYAYILIQPRTIGMTIGRSL